MIFTNRIKKTRVLRLVAIVVRLVAIVDVLYGWFLPGGFYHYIGLDDNSLLYIFFPHSCGDRLYRLLLVHNT